MAKNAVTGLPNHNHYLSNLLDVDDTLKADGYTLVWNSSTGYHIYAEGGGGGDIIFTGLDGGSSLYNIFADTIECGTASIQYTEVIDGGNASN